MSAHSRIRGVGAARIGQSAPEREGRAFLDDLNRVAAAALLGRMAIDKVRADGGKESEALRRAFVETKQDLMALVSMTCNAAGGNVRIRVPESVWGRGRGGEFSAGCVQVLSDEEFSTRLARGAAAPTTSVDLGAFFLAVVPFIPVIVSGAVKFAVVVGAAVTLGTLIEKFSPGERAAAHASRGIADARAVVFAKLAAGEITQAQADKQLAALAKSEAASMAAEGRRRLAQPGFFDKIFGPGSGRIIIWSTVGLGALGALYYFWPVIAARMAARQALPVSTRNT